MTIPKKYRKSRDNIIASFDFVDIAEGAGTVNYNGSSSSVTTTPSYFLTRTTNPADEVYTWILSSDEASTELFNVDFSITFLAPRIIAVGTVRAMLPLGIGADVTTAKTIIAKVTMSVDGTTIGSQITSRTVTRPDPTTAGQPYSDLVNVPLPVTERINIGIGSILNFNVEIWGSNVGGNGHFALGHDPANRSDPRTPGAGSFAIFEDGETTRSTFSVPFVITT